MLVLTRRLGERILIGNDIWVMVVSIDRGKVRIGVDAPEDVTVVREELLETGKKPQRRTTKAKRGQ